jgi:hypothetical protein
MLIMQVFHDSSHMLDTGRNTWLWSYVGLRSEDVIPVVCPTLVERRNSGRMPNYGQKMWLQSYCDSGRMPDPSQKTRLLSEDVILVICATLLVCLTLAGRSDSGCMPDFGRKIRLWSCVLTPVALPDSNRCHDSDCISWFWSRITALMKERATCLTNSSVKDYAWTS